MLCITERCTINATGEVKLDIKKYHYQCTSAMALCYRERIPSVSITLDHCRALKMGVTMLTEGLIFDLNEQQFLERCARFKEGRYDYGHT